MNASTPTIRKTLSTSVIESVKTLTKLGVKTSECHVKSEYFRCSSGRLPLDLKRYVKLMYRRRSISRRFEVEPYTTTFVLQ